MFTQGTILLLQKSQRGAGRCEGQTRAGERIWPAKVCVPRQEGEGRGAGDQVSRAHTDYLHALNTNQVNKAGVIELVYKISV